MAFPMEPIECPEQLPKPDAANERAGLDFKAVPATDHWTIATDVAAMANSDGGTILIGAVARGEILESYRPLSPADGSAAQVTYEQAIKSRCRPVPLVSVVMIPEGTGVVLAVNVSPFPGQLVGVELKQGEAICGAKPTKPQDVFFFPRRAGAHNVAILPEQMPMFFDARTRRIAIQLAEAKGKKVLAWRLKSRSGVKTENIRLESLTVVDVDLLGSAVTFDVPTPESRASKPIVERMAIPIDCIEGVGRSGDTWNVILRGWFEFFGETAPDVAPELARIDGCFVPEG